MIRKSLVIAIAVFSTNVAVALDCGTTTLTHEKIYCSSPNLQVLGTRLTEAFSKALKETNNAQLLRQEQTDWLNRDLRTCTSEQCMEQAYKKRTAELATIKAADTSDRRNSITPNNTAQLGGRDGGRNTQNTTRDNAPVSTQAPIVAPVVQSNTVQEEIRPPVTQSAPVVPTGNQTNDTQNTTTPAVSIQAPKEEVAQPITNKQEEVGNAEPSFTSKLGAFWDELWFYLQFVYGVVVGYLIFNYFNKMAKAVVPEGNGNRIVRNGNFETLSCQIMVFVMAYFATYGIWQFVIFMVLSVGCAIYYATEETGIAFCNERKTIEIPSGFSRIEIPVNEIKGTSGDLTTTHEVKKDAVTGKYKGETTMVWTLTIKVINDSSYDMKFKNRQTYELARDLIAEVSGLS